MLADLMADHQRMAAGVPLDFTRFLTDDINWNARLIAIVGPRGTGKTTLVLQHFRQRYGDIQKCLYISADHPLVAHQGIFETVREYFRYYGECVIIDEVHKEPDWSMAVKTLFDAYPDKKFIILGSSSLQLLRTRGDLSRRMLVYHLPPLSFREFVNVRLHTTLAPISLAEIRTGHLGYTQHITTLASPILHHFTEYLLFGGFPFFLHHAPDEYGLLLRNVLDKVVYEDIPSVQAIQPLSSLKLKRLIAYLATSKIPLFNTETLTRELEVSRDTLYEYVDLLERANLLQVVRPAGKPPRGIKQAKLLFSSPNLYYAVAREFWQVTPDKGNLRESFLAAQLRVRYPLSVSPQVDFQARVSEGQILEMEVGGPGKGQRQIKGLPNAVIFKDGIEHGVGTTIPLYLAGFVY